MVAQPNQFLMSVEDYLTLDSSSLETRYEYIDGYVYMMAGGNADHSTISIHITSLLSTLLRGSPCRVYNSDLKVRLSETRYVYPDASVSCDERDRGKITTVHSPHIIVEVLSPSTEAYDRGKKFALYRACPTVQEYMLVDSQQQAVEVYRRAKNNLWTLHAFGPDDLVQLASLSISFPVAALYENVTLPDEASDN